MPLVDGGFQRAVTKSQADHGEWRWTRQGWVPNNFLAEALGHARTITGDRDNRVPVANNSLVLTRRAEARLAWSWSEQQQVKPRLPGPGEASRQRSR
jgi:hypothetical protein